MWRAALPSRCVSRFARFSNGGANPALCSDRGTTGLGGPTRADAPDDGSLRDYIAFVLNVGEPRDNDYGGGTYGFGKAAFFISSQAHAIMVSSQCDDGYGGIESRLIGCALGESYSTKEANFTGRAWWGDAREQLVEPLRVKLRRKLPENLVCLRLGRGKRGPQWWSLRPISMGAPPRRQGHTLLTRSRGTSGQKCSPPIKRASPQYSSPFT